jgi:hypothetical protein
MSGAIGALAVGNLDMTNEQLSAIRANVGGPRTCERWAKHWTQKGRECNAVADADACYSNARTLLDAAQAMRNAPVTLALESAK